jgi:hypothetical protein
MTSKFDVFDKREVMSVFGSVVALGFQSVFHLEKHANNVFLFFKNYF